MRSRLPCEEAAALDITAAGRNVSTLCAICSLAIRGHWILDAASESFLSNSFISVICELFCATIFISTLNGPVVRF